MSEAKAPSRRELLERIETLTRQLEEAEETLRAIRSGEVDAIIVSGTAGEQVFSLAGTDQVYRLIVETMSEAALTVDLDGTITFCNAQFGKLLGLPIEQLIGRRLAELVGPEDRGAVAELLAQGKSRPVRMRMTFQGVQRDVPTQVAANLLSHPDGDALCVVATDLTELERRAHQLRALAMQLTTVEQRERRRLAGILHDHLQQLLVGARYQVELFNRRGDEETRSIAARVDELLAQSITLSRSLTAELSTPVLYSEGLLPALRWLAIWMHSNHGLSVNVSAEEPIPDIGEQARTLLFQSARELLLNVAKHGRTDSAFLDVRQAHGGLRITVSDKGNGFDPSALANRTEEQGFGIFSIREKLSLMGGSVEIESAPGKGSRVSLRVPADSLEPSTQARDAAGRTGAISVLVIDDHEPARTGLAGFLGTASGIEVIGQCGSGDDAVRLAKELHPDVVVMDTGLSPMRSAVAVRIVRENSPGCQVIGLALHDEEETRTAWREAGAAACLRKDGPLDALVEAIRACVGPWARGSPTGSPQA